MIVPLKTITKIKLHFQDLAIVCHRKKENTNNRSGVKASNLQSASFSSPGFLKFALIQDMVWMNFKVSDMKFNYTEKFKITIIKSPLNFIGDTVDFYPNLRGNYFQTLLKWF